MKTILRMLCVVRNAVVVEVQGKRYMLHDSATYTYGVVGFEPSRTLFAFSENL